MKFLTAYRKLLDGEFSYITRTSWEFQSPYLTRVFLSSYLVWDDTFDYYRLSESDAFADDWEGIK